MNHHNLLLVSYELCPYVQRSIIMLVEQQIEHDREYIDLNDPPAWFIEKSPLGKVPLLIVDNEHVIFESAVICEFLDEITPGSLHDDDPITKATHRAWIEYGSQILNDIGSLYCSATKSNYQQISEEICKKFLRLEKIIQTPYFSGEDFRMVDAVYATIFRYFDVMDAYLPFNIFANTPKISAWRRNLAKRDSVIKGVKADYPVKLLDFLQQRNSYISRMMTQRESIPA